LKKKYNDRFIDELLNNQEGPEIHRLFMEFDVIIRAFFNEDNFINSNLFEYYRLSIESNYFINDVDALLSKILIVNPTILNIIRIYYFSNT